jgi:fructose-1,6-bisphosphatase/inositol monophosphatase family enzyme
VWRDRGYGDTWPYMLLAEGRLEFVAEFGVKEYDIAALVPIITEAGGRFTDIDGPTASPPGLPSRRTDCSTTTSSPC